MNRPLEEGADFYYDDGFVVFTEKYLSERGYCCGNGCRHCPYNQEAVPEPRRTALSEERKRKQDR